MALGASKAITEAGLKIPQDISVIGCDNVKILNMITPTLSTIDVQAFRLGCALMQALLNTIMGETNTKEIITAKFLSKQSISEAKIK